jgi:hypothetical protein
MSSGSKSTSGIGAVGLCGRALGFGVGDSLAEPSATYAVTEALEHQNQRAAADAAIRAYLKHLADAVAMVFGDWEADPSHSRQRDVSSF